MYAKEGGNTRPIGGESTMSKVEVILTNLYNALKDYFEAFIKLFKELFAGVKDAVSTTANENA